MAYDEQLAQKVDAALADEGNITRKNMFGGLCYLINGNMCVGVEKDRLMVRVGPDDYQAALEEEYAHEMDFTGRPLKGFVYVHADGLDSITQVQQWVDRSLAFARSLPRKEKKAKKKK